MFDKKLMIFKWENNSYGIPLDKLKSAKNKIPNLKKIHPFFQIEFVVRIGRFDLFYRSFRNLKGSVVVMRV